MRKPGRWRLSAQVATQEIRKRAATSGNVLLTQHAQEQMAARDIIAAEVFRILREGHVFELPVVEREEWKSIMELRMPGGGERPPPSRY